MVEELHICGGNNRYHIVENQDRHLLLECTWFCNREDLGDLIYCEREGQRIWVAKYHSDHMVKEVVDIIY